VGRIEAVLSDFGGVLTSPLRDTFRAFQDSSGISLASLGSAMAAVAARTGANPLFELETGRLTEADFLAALAAELTEQLGRTVELHGFGEAYFNHLDPNGVRKPEPEIYRLTLERLGVNADTALLVDDIEANCDGARELGMQAVWFRSTEQAIEDIEAVLAS
jgi:putative hydrolase of the HAD superfamily